jgi:hypothetical protein
MQLCWEFCFSRRLVPRHKLQCEWESDLWLPESERSDRNRFVLTVTIGIIRMLVRRTVTGGRATLSVACLWASDRGITRIGGGGIGAGATTGMAITAARAGDIGRATGMVVQPVVGRNMVSSAAILATTAAAAPDSMAAVLADTTVEVATVAATGK